MSFASFFDRLFPPVPPPNPQHDRLRAAIADTDAARSRWCRIHDKIRAPSRWRPDDTMAAMRSEEREAWEQLREFTERQDKILKEMD